MWPLETLERLNEEVEAKHYRELGKRLELWHKSPEYLPPSEKPVVGYWKSSAQFPDGFTSLVYVKWSRFFNMARFPVSSPDFWIELPEEL